MSQLKEKYQKDVVKALKATGKYPSTMDVPRVVKVVVNHARTAGEKRSITIGPFWSSGVATAPGNP